ncbi:hypothetical protein P376_5042 [Streptomyces sp. HCCB10043]|nr:hypothetical protein P376_5042 [Streptomyces sp. HCCB10043]
MPFVPPEDSYSSACRATQSAGLSATSAVPSRSPSCSAVMGFSFSRGAPYGLRLHPGIPVSPHPGFVHLDSPPTARGNADRGSAREGV